MAESLTDVLKRRRELLEGRGNAIDAAVDTAVRGAPRGAPGGPKPKKKKPTEKVGVGAPDTSALDAGIARVRKQIDATQDPAKKSELEARIKAMRANQP